MARVILHIGTHKTATTTIQNTFAANRALLARHGVIYPDLGRVAGHHGLVMQWLPLPSVYELPGGAAAGWARVGALARKSGVVFLSSEEFSRGQPLPRVDLRELRRHLAPFDRIEVLCTLRDQLSYLQSIYLEVSKKHVPPPWPTFLANSLASGFGAGLFLDFNALDDFLRGAFARDEIKYLDFASSQARPGGILGEVLRQAGTQLTPGDLTAVDNGAANVSPDPLAAWAANQIAAPYPAPPDLVSLASATPREELEQGVRTTIYTRAEEARLLGHFAPLNARFVERITQTAPDFRLTMPSPPRKRLYRDDVGPAFWIRMARRLHARDRLAPA
ncbi:MAG: hypothetical protein GC186_00625 [Rhodobacteraceae bacterium]|nr:hypothetical protein [Paracoccaceae bacterium]